MTNNCGRKSLEVECSLVNIQDQPSSDVKDKMDSAGWVGFYQDKRFKTSPKS